MEENGYHFLRWTLTPEGTKRVSGGSLLAFLRTIAPSKESLLHEEIQLMPKSPNMLLLPRDTHRVFVGRVGFRLSWAAIG